MWLNNLSRGFGGFNLKIGNIVPVCSVNDEHSFLEIIKAQRFGL